MANARPLDDAALARLREDLAAGKRPSLVLLSGGAGLPPGAAGSWSASTTRRRTPSSCT